MELNAEIVSDYIGYFFSKIVGFENQEVRYTAISESSNEFLSIAMDKIDRLTRKSGKLRVRVWSNCYFIFHNNEIDPSKIYKDKVATIKKRSPFLFIRSYVYFIFINISEEKQTSFLEEPHRKIKTRDYKIWLFNSKYELQEETKRTNLFGITLDENEVLDDYIYLANPDSELKRIESSNSDAVDCVRAFTGDLELLEQTSEMLDEMRSEFNENPSARIVLEGPARSGKTIIAATLLGEYTDSKFLLMNYFFYQAIVDGFHALSGWDTQEINELVKNPELDLLLSLKDSIPKLLERISQNLLHAIKECSNPKPESKTKQWLIENVEDFKEGFEKFGFEESDLPIYKSLMNLYSKLKITSDEKPFIGIDQTSLKELKKRIDWLLSGKYDSIRTLQEKVVKTIEELIKNSKQKFFHHNINKNISSKIKDGCWISRGNPTTSKMWTNNYHPKLIICDEVQRLGRISEYKNYDEFDEVNQILMHSEQSFFTGDNFQMLNSKYDQGIERISSAINDKGQTLTKRTLPESVGVPAEIGILMKCLTNPQAVSIETVVDYWVQERDFEIIFMESNVNHLISLLDGDLSNKKHLASPMDYTWIDNEEIIQINTYHRGKPIIPLGNHEKEDFAYKFPYFCNEEIMSNYILSAYELISREVESLYVHIPKFKKLQPVCEEWYRKHLYVLFTRPTNRLVVNFDVRADFERVRSVIRILQESGAKLSVTFQN